MKVARILYPVTVLGPGKRIAIWVAGCKRACKGCASPELWNATAEQEISVENLLAAIQGLIEKVGGTIDGITISGGEPFEQVDELGILIDGLLTNCSDILIFTGYTREKLMQKEGAQEILDKIAVLVDGPYIEEQNAGEVLRGSVNQKIRYRDKATRERYEEYQYMHREHHMVENFTVKDGVIAVGIHKKDFKEALEKRLMEKQIVTTQRR